MRLFEKNQALHSSTAGRRVRENAALTDGNEEPSVRSRKGLPRSVELSQRGYRLFAPIYDMVFGLGLQHGRKLAIATLECRTDDRVLEIGVGTGLSLPLYPAGVNITGIDVSRDMLRIASRRVSSRPVAGIVTLVRTDAQRLAFGDASFDRAVVMFAASGLPDPVGAMVELKRVCRPGATLVVANRFRSERLLSRVFDVLLWPIHRLLRYRADLDVDDFIAAAGLEVMEQRPANLFGYSTVLVCRARADLTG